VFIISGYHLNPKGANPVFHITCKGGNYEFICFSRELEKRYQTESERMEEAQ